LTDPETYDWNPLDRDYQLRLDQRPFVSLSRERGLGTEIDTAPSNSDHLQSEVTNESSESEESQDEMEEDISSSLFAAKMPGVMTLDEVELQCNLDNIPVAVKGQSATAEVSV
jgi:hypothetical protein